MFKQIIAVFLILSTLLSAVACGSETESASNAVSDGSEAISATESKTEQTSSEAEAESSATVEESKDESDKIPPAFVDATDGKLEAITHNTGEEIDILAGLTVRDNVTADADIVVSISDDGGYSKDTAGTYTVTIEAKDQAGNTATVTVEITVKAVSSKKEIVLGDKLPYVKNEAEALSYTPSGTKFRTADKVQVMDKDFFIDQYNEFYKDHTNNGKVPYFPNGIIIFTDKDYNIVQARLAVGETVQIDSKGNLTNKDLTWTNSIDATNGGGMFKNIVNDIKSLLPDCGYILFVGNPGDSVCRNTLVKELFFTGYAGGPVTLDQCDVSLAGAKVKLG
jgi:hypothetical protein